MIIGALVHGQKLEYISVSIESGLQGIPSKQCFVILAVYFFHTSLALLEIMEIH